jgi:hypothetical protein
MSKNTIIWMSRLLSASYKKKALFMLGKWLLHKEYQKYVVSELSELARLNPYALLEYQNEISKVFILNLDLLKTVIAPLYSTTGRPSNLQPEIFRSFIIMNSLGFTPDKWLKKLQNNYVLRVIIGREIPSLGSHYDFMNRLYKIDEKPLHKPKKRKPSKKVGRNKKLPNRRSGIVGRIVAGIFKGKKFNCGSELVFQKIFAEVSVKSSIDLGLIGKKVSVSGDGTCIETGASHFGVKTCECKDFKCNCPRKFPNSLCPLCRHHLLQNHEENIEKLISLCWQRSQQSQLQYRRYR